MEIEKVTQKRQERHRLQKGNLLKGVGAVCLLSPLLQIVGAKGSSVWREQVAQKILSAFMCKIQIWTVHALLPPPTHPHQITTRSSFFTCGEDLSETKLHALLT